jgi:hypothetical protein
MENLYVKTLLVYLLILIVFLITILVWNFFFIVFVIVSTIITKRRSLVMIKKDELTLNYVLFNLTLMVTTMGSLFLIVRAVL